MPKRINFPEMLGYWPCGSCRSRAGRIDIASSADLLSAGTDRQGDRIATVVFITPDKVRATESARTSDLVVESTSVSFFEAETRCQSGHGEVDQKRASRSVVDVRGAISARGRAVGKGNNVFCQSPAAWLRGAATQGAARSGSPTDRHPWAEGLSAGHRRVSR